MAYMEFPSQENPLAILTMILATFGQIVAYLLILYLFNSGFLGRIFNVIKKLIFGTKSTQVDSVDDDVRQERDQVQQFRNLVSTSSGDYNIREAEEDGNPEGLTEEEELEFGYISVANKLPKSRLRRRKKMDFYEFDDIDEESPKISLLVDGLRKNYISWFKKFTAVSNVSFVVERGTCFGLLGVNGAGKSTTFKMLTGEILPTSGDARIDSFKLSEKKSEYLAVAGYCAQTNCFIEQLTGLEMLTIIASLRGVQAQDRRKLVNKWISIIGLEEYKNRRCGSYSGGNKRKLCSAMSLIGDPHVVFLDEPTSGVDPVSRRNLYDVMAQSKASGQTVVLTSHSMEECETLCDRLTIMVSGVMKCIGSAQHLKKVYAQGFSALFKIFDSPDAHDKIPELKRTIEQVFNPSRIILKDEHTGLLYYQIIDTSLLWSVLFEMMENIKSYHQDVVQDYVITDTTLEEVFISFAKNR